ncbi:helix-hairpin-helix domain-containing protein [Klebsiella pneumoniae]|nr:helix-hairpin-helix domain-containing protein [Klebsiella pneumoniae]
MVFSSEDKAVLLAVKGVGTKVVERLEQMGFSDLNQLAAADAQSLLSAGAALTGSTCWRNSPLARKAIESAIAAARQAQNPS